MSSSSGAVASSSSGRARPLVRTFNYADDWEQFYNDVKEKNQLVIIFFYALWCSPSASMDAIFLDLANRYKDIAFVKVNVNELYMITSGFNVWEIPQFIALKQGKELERFIGAKAEKLIAMVEKHRVAI